MTIRKKPLKMVASGSTKSLPFGDANYVRVNLATQLDTMQEIIQRMGKVVAAAPGKQN